MMHPFARTRRQWLASFGLAALLLLGAAPPQAAAPTEYQVKAVFLFNFSQFVTWPAQAFPEAQNPLIIGVLGDDPFGADLDEIVRGETVNGHPLAVRRFRRVEDIDDCHILFINAAEEARLEQILRKLQGRSILTVSDGQDFAKRGVMVRFITDRNRIRLRINLTATEAAGLTLSSKLLRPAEIIRAGEN